MAFLVGLSINVFASDTTGVLSVEQNIAIENADYYRQLSDEYEKQGDYRHADSVYNLYIDIQRNLFDEAAMNNLTAMKKAQADAEQNELQEKEMQRINMVHASNQKHLRTIMVAVVIGIVLMAFLAGFIIKLIRTKRRANNQLTNANIELAQQRKEIEHQCDLIAQSKEELVSANDQIINSIRYAQRIQ
ncbi:MAG: hypothetical protein II165_02320, partial [Bacteroidales bacterium]|nr:hypothetical protein [Bacteroidales bacterium]